MKNYHLHYHSLEPCGDDRGHFYCRRWYCGMEFWSDEAIDGMLYKAGEDNFYAGVKAGRSIGYNYREIKHKILWRIRKFYRIFRENYAKIKL